jgi:hypothetical protein
MTTIINFSFSGNTKQAIPYSRWFQNPFPLTLSLKRVSLLLNYLASNYSVPGTVLDFNFVGSLEMFLAGRGVSLGQAQQSGAVRSSPSFKTYQGYKTSYCYVSGSRQLSSNMQSSHNTPRNDSNQLHQTFMFSSDSPSYVGQGGQSSGSGYHPIVQSAEAQRSSYGHPQVPHHLGMFLTFDPNYSLLTISNYYRRRQSHGLA